MVWTVLKVHPWFVHSIDSKWIWDDLMKNKYEKKQRANDWNDSNVFGLWKQNNNNNKFNRKRQLRIYWVAFCFYLHDVSFFYYYFLTTSLFVLIGIWNRIWTWNFTDVATGILFLCSNEIFFTILNTWTIRFNWLLVFSWILFDTFSQPVINWWK